MKKLLLTSVALSGLAFAAPAHADIDLEIGGFFNGYGAYVDQDETAGTESNNFGLLRHSELHFGGETTLDNGLTIGAQIEVQIDAADASAIDESYIYFSGDWGRVNFGAEDGAAYLLQVAAPSADSNVDSIRQYIQPFTTNGGLTPIRLDYDMAPSGKADKLTYLSPIMNGVQVGLSYSAETDAASDLVGGIGLDDQAGDIGATYEAAIRYEGQIQNVGVIAGAGYSHGELEANGALTDDLEVWNIGLDLDIGPFGIGAIYMDDNQAKNNSDLETLVIGVDYTTGPFKIGASYLNADVDNGVEYDRYTAGVTYEYGPGLTFRGSIQQLEQDSTGSDADGTALLLGTKVVF
ncbi:MAG: porin [Alphaproteobacteria bacterium]|nr:MAG: porin [Alphaproteobacteria bacterium]